MRSVRLSSWKDEFLRHLREGHSISAAASMAGVARRTAYRARQLSPRFAREWDDAYREGTDALLEEARKRAMAGSDRLLALLIQVRMRKLADEEEWVEIE